MMDFKIVDVGGTYYIEYRNNSNWKVYRNKGKTVLFKSRDEAEAEGLVQFHGYIPYDGKLKEENTGYKP
jgi:hypothetical protein